MVVWRVTHIGISKGTVDAREPITLAGVEPRREKLFAEFADSGFTEKITGSPPVRGPFGEAVINLKPGAVPMRQRPYHIVGERRTAWLKLTDELVERGLIEPGVGSWSLPSFPVPKKNPGEYRFVQDFRPLNDATEDDAHPLPRIEDILQRQGSCHMWSFLDLKSGYHQMPLKLEHRPLTCMSPQGGQCNGGCW